MGEENSGLFGQFNPDRLGYKIRKTDIGRIIRPPERRYAVRRRDTNR